MQSDSFFVPLDCPICELMMRDMKDSVQYLETNCCVECWISLVEPLRKLKEDKDFSPSEEHISRYREKLVEDRIIKQEEL